MGQTIKIKTEGYNGHQSWDHWNVSLWLSNDEWLYKQCTEAIKNHPNLSEAAGALMWFYQLDGKTTPDGGEFNLSTVTEALRGLFGGLMRESKLSNELASEFGCKVVSRADYEDDMASFGFYYELYGANAPLKQITQWVKEWARDHHYFRCGCAHDCCGCSFLQFC